MSTLSLKSLQEQIDEMKLIIEAQSTSIALLQEQVKNPEKVRDRGPKSEGEMSDSDAIRCMLGDLKDASHKDAALALKLSYGQIYSARKGYTFKKVYQRMARGEEDNSCNPVEEIQEVQEVQEVQDIQNEGEA